MLCFYTAVHVFLLMFTKCSLKCFVNQKNSEGSGDLYIRRVEVFVYILIDAVKCVCLCVRACVCACDGWSRWSSSRCCDVMGPSWALSCDVSWQHREFMRLTKTFNLLEPPRPRTHMNTYKNTHNDPNPQQEDKHSFRLTAHGVFSHRDYWCADVCCALGKKCYWSGIKLMNEMFSFKLAKNNRHEVCVVCEREMSCLNWAHRWQTLLIFLLAHLHVFSWLTANTSTFLSLG